MGFNWRKRFRLGPLFVNIANGRFTSWGFKWGRYTRNMTSGKTTIDTPGPGSYTYGGKKRGGRR